MVYVFIFAITTILGIIASKEPQISSNSHKTGIIPIGPCVNQRKLCMFLIFTVYVAFVGFRSVTVGSDSGNYNYYLIAGSLSSFDDYITLYFHDDVGFFILTWLIGRVSTAYPLFFTVYAVIYFYAFIKFADTYSENPGWSIWLINALGLATFAMSTMRQATSMAFCLLAFMSRDKRQKRAWVYFALAVSFHLSAAVFLPMMFSNILKKLGMLSEWMIIVLVIVAGLSPALMQFLRLNVYGEKYGQTQVGGLGMILFLLLLCIGGWYYLIKLKRAQGKDIDFLIAIYLGLLVFLVTRFNLAALRTYYVFFMISIVYLPNLLNRMRRSSKWVIGSVLFLMSVIYLRTTVFINPYPDGSKLLPYAFFWSTGI